MSPEVQQQIFEPFFTTKTNGTGLGLPNVYGIVRQCGGHISVYSELGVGTTFKIFLPVHVEGAGRVPVEKSAAADLAAGTVLLVEDDEAVRGLVRRTLHGSGYTVMEAHDGEEALSILREQSGAIDVVVTDVNMPQMNGYELADRIADMQPRAGVVIMSGFAEESLERGAEPPTRRRFLEKPFTPVSLVRAVRDSMAE
jgi:two-component system cell cycle sensor histidine kinase/response regulator CckA